jgi:hypothetical protein
LRRELSEAGFARVSFLSPEEAKDRTIANATTAFHSLAALQSDAHWSDIWFDNFEREMTPGCEQMAGEEAFGQSSERRDCLTSRTYD